MKVDVKGSLCIDDIDPGQRASKRFTSLFSVNNSFAAAAFLFPIASLQIITSLELYTLIQSW